MSYTNSTPNTGNSLNFTRDLINTNFSEIFVVNGKNHEDFNSANKGKHKFLQMPVQASAPATAASEGGLYTADDGDGVAQLYYGAEGAGSTYQLTKAASGADPTLTEFGTNTSYGSPPSGWTQTGGWTFLPGGLIMQYGFYGKSGATGTTGTIEFPRTYTLATNVFSVTLTVIRSTSDRYANLNTISETSFTFATTTPGTDGIYWQAIGIA